MNIIRTTLAALGTLLLVTSFPAMAKDSSCYKQTVKALDTLIIKSGAAKKMTPAFVKSQLEAADAKGADGAAAVSEKLSLPTVCKPLARQNVLAFAGLGVSAESKSIPVSQENKKPAEPKVEVAEMPITEAAPVKTEEKPAVAAKPVVIDKSDPAAAARQRQLESEQAALEKKQRQLQVQQAGYLARIEQLNKKIDEQPQMSRLQYDELQMLLPKEKKSKALLDLVVKELDKVKKQLNELEMRLYGRMEKNDKGKWVLVKKGDIPQLQADVAKLKQSDYSFWDWVSWIGGLVGAVIAVIGLAFGIRKLF